MLGTSHPILLHLDRRKKINDAAKLIQTSHRHRGKIDEFFGHLYILTGMVNNGDLNLREMSFANISKPL